MIHIAEETAREISKHHLTRVGLLGTKFTMEQSFFKDKLKQQGIETVIPDSDERNVVHQSIFNELACGIFTDSTKQSYLKIIDQLKLDDIQGIVFGCSEICLLIDPASLGIPVFDTTSIHAGAAAAFAMS